MSAPQPPADQDPAAPGDFGRRDAPATGSDGTTYDFHGEKLDFDPYRFGAPEPVAPAWSPPSAPAGEPGRAPTPGERWSPGGSEPGPEVRPGDYWQGGGSTPRQDAVFPPAGYAPPGPESGRPGGGVDLGKPGTSGPPPAGYPPPYGQTPSGPPPSGGYPAPGSYPGRSGPSEADRWRAGNKIAVWGFGVAMLGCALFFTSFFAVLIGGTGLGLSIAGLVKARRGAPHRTFAVLGIVFSIVAIAAGIAILVYALSQYDLTCIANLDGDTGRLSECVR